MADAVVYAGFSIGALIVAIAVVLIVASTVRTAVNPEEGIHAFCRSFDGAQFEARDERGGRR